MHEKARKILAENREKLDELAMYLYEKETITGDKFMAVSYTHLFAITLIAGCTNMLLDWILVGICGLGIAGAAWATVTSPVSYTHLDVYKRQVCI